MNVKMVIKNTDGTSSEETSLLTFKLKKEAYLPYTLLSARVLTSVLSYEDAAEIMLYIGNRLVHHGLVDELRTVKTGGRCITTLSSRGFTSLLCQNQIEPGLKTGVSINSLMDSFYSFPHVEHENNSASSYIFVKSSSSMWDALVNLSYKLCGTYPYIRGTNTIRMTQHGSPTSFSYSRSTLLSEGTELVCRRLVSDFHMSDINGDYGTFELNDSDAAARGIVRHKFFELDRQYLYAPQQALEYRDKYAARGFRRSFCSYKGYNGEELSDVVTFGSVTAGRIACIEITGSSRGVVTELSVYSDKFPH